MTKIKKPKGMGPVGSVLISLAGAVASVLVTMQLKKMLAAKGLSERKADLKTALKGAGATAADLKATATSWIQSKAADAADTARSTATSAADKVTEAASTVKEQANG